MLFACCQQDPNNNEEVSCPVSCNCGSGGKAAAGDSSTTTCCSATANEEGQRCPSLKWTTPANLPDEGEGDRLRQYAYAGLVAGGAILLSRIALRLFYAK